MEIYLDGEKEYRLVSDMHNAWVEKKIKSKRPPKGTPPKNAFKWERKTGYYGQLDQLLKKVIDAKLLGSDADTVEKLLAEIKKIHAVIDEAIPQLQKAFTERRTRGRWHDR